MVNIPRPIANWVRQFLTDEPHDNDAHTEPYVASDTDDLQVLRQDEDPGEVDRPTLWLRRIDDEDE